MKINIRSFLISIFLIFSCNGVNAIKDNTNKEIQNKEVTVLKESKKNSTAEAYKDIFDVDLIGMEAVEGNKNGYEKYAVDFEDACYSSELLKMKITNQKVLISNYYDSRINSTFLIDKMNISNDSLIIITKPKGLLKISKIKNLPIYSIFYKGNFHQEISMSKFISKEIDIKLFGGIDCGDFDG